MTATATAPSPKADRAPRQIKLGPMRQSTARSLRKLSTDTETSHPAMTVHRHMAEAATQVEAGNEEGALRHLRAAVYSLQPLSLRRHGLHDDDSHIAARRTLEEVIRHHHLVKDIQDADARNKAAISRDSYGDNTTAPPLQEPPPGLRKQRPYDDAPRRPAVRRQPGGDKAMNAPAVIPSGRPDPSVAKLRRPPVKVSAFAGSWDEVATVVGLSAETPMLEATPAPRGRPGGPGLYFKKGNKHSDYLEQVVRALITERGMPPARAYAIAWGALRRWVAKSKHPEVRAAAGLGLTQEAEAGARAHSHAATWDEVAAVVDLAVVQVRTYQRTVQTPAGARTEVVRQHAQNRKDGIPKAATGKNKGAPSKAAEKQRLLATAAGDRKQAALLGVEKEALTRALNNALYGKNTTTAQTGATTSAQSGATTTASASTQAAAAATKAGASTAQVAQTTAQAQAAAAKMNVAQLRTAIKQIQARITWLDKHATGLTQQAAKL